jgi:hypothetical protein
VVHGTPTKIPAGPAIEVKAAALREDTIRSVSVWSPNRNKRNHLAAGKILPPFFILYSEVGFPFKAKIRTILENFPKGFLWYGIPICFGMHDLTICIYHQLVMTYFFISVWKGLLV